MGVNSISQENEPVVVCYIGQHYTTQQVTRQLDPDANGQTKAAARCEFQFVSRVCVLLASASAAQRIGQTRRAWLARPDPWPVHCVAHLRVSGRTLA